MRTDHESGSRSSRDERLSLLMPEHPGHRSRAAESYQFLNFLKISSQVTAEDRLMVSDAVAHSAQRLHVGENPTTQL